MGISLSPFRLTRRGQADTHVANIAVEGVAEQEGQRYFDVRAHDMTDRIAEDELRWTWRLVFTSVGNVPVIGIPVTLVVAQKAGRAHPGDPKPRSLRVACIRCGRAGSASLFRTMQYENDADVYFTRCRRCWRSNELGRFRRGQHRRAQPAPAGPQAGTPPIDH